MDYGAYPIHSKQQYNRGTVSELACPSTAHLVSLPWSRSKGTSDVSRGRFGTHVCTSLVSVVSFSAVAAVPEPSLRVQLHVALSAFCASPPGGAELAQQDLTPAGPLKAPCSRAAAMG